MLLHYIQKQHLLSGQRIVATAMCQYRSVSPSRLCYCPSLSLVLSVHLIRPLQSHYSVFNGIHRNKCSSSAAPLSMASRSYNYL